MHRFAWVYLVQIEKFCEAAKCLELALDFLDAGTLINAAKSFSKDLM